MRLKPHQNLCEPVSDAVPQFREFFTLKTQTAEAQMATPSNDDFSGHRSEGAVSRSRRVSLQPETINLQPVLREDDPDPNNPVVIKMWKLQGAEPLVGIDQHYKIPVTGAPVNVDLLAGKIVPSGGDLRITVSRPSGIVSQGNPQDWSVKIEPMGGGLIETSIDEARVAYAVPDNGYQPSDTIVMSTTNHWSNLAQQMLFVRSQDGQVFSKVFLSFGINANPDDPMSVTVRGVANGNGSRNFEADANTMKP
jgi:hypothetical protein